MTSSPQAWPRQALLGRLAHPERGRFDLLVIGGGATGLGIALDAACRGLSVALVEADDFAKGASSRATKLLHGGVRYLAQGNIALVREALHERTYVLENAPHLATPLPFLLPTYQWRDLARFGAGLMMYAALAGRKGLGGTCVLNRRTMLDLAPEVRSDRLRGGVQYWDAQFDDARLAVAIARTAAQQGAVLVNHCAVRTLIHDAKGCVCGATVLDKESNASLDILANCVINATGAWADRLRQLDAQATRRDFRASLVPSQGTHLVVDRAFWSADHALLVPGTRDGRVLFAVPWQGKVLLGTTDHPVQTVHAEPKPQRHEAIFILKEMARYLTRTPSLSDVRSVWAGLRPLAAETVPGKPTRALSREHLVQTSPSGLVTVTGGKWTTYRAMAQDVLHHCIAHALLPAGVPSCQTQHLALAGFSLKDEDRMRPGQLSTYGADTTYLNRLPGAQRRLHPQHTLTEAMVRFAVRHEFARTVEDVLARRSRILFLDAELAQAMAPRVADIVREETGVDPRLSSFMALACDYTPQAW